MRGVKTCISLRCRLRWVALIFTLSVASEREMDAGGKSMAPSAILTIPLSFHDHPPVSISPMKMTAGRAYWIIFGRRCFIWLFLFALPPAPPHYTNLFLQRHFSLYAHFNFPSHFDRIAQWKWQYAANACSAPHVVIIFWNKKGERHQRKRDHARRISIPLF